MWSKLWRHENALLAWNGFCLLRLLINTEAVACFFMTAIKKWAPNTVYFCLSHKISQNVFQGEISDQVTSEFWEVPKFPVIQTGEWVQQKLHESHKKLAEYLEGFSWAKSYPQSTIGKIFNSEICWN